MNAAELRALAERLTKIVPADLAAAAEILGLIAWAEESGLVVDRGEGLWSAWWEGGPQVYAKTLLDTLRRAREASKS